MLLGEPNVQVRRTIADTLRQQGYHSIRDTAQFDVIDEAVRENQVDVLICDVELGGRDLCEMIYQVRHHYIGNNPFMVTIALTDNPTTDVIRRIINSGADDLLLKPVSVGQILDRLKILTHNRKGFVVTTDYIGPDRRKNGARPGSQEIPILDVPNPLNFQAANGDATAALEMQAAITEAAQLINTQKMERHAYQIQYLVDKIVPSYSIGDIGQDLFTLVARLVFVSEDLVRRMTGTKFEHVRELGETMIRLATTIRQQQDGPDMKNVHLLPQLAAAIKQAFSDDEHTAAVARDISQSIGQRSN